MFEINQNVRVIDYIDYIDLWIPEGAIGVIVAPSTLDLSAWVVDFGIHGVVYEVFEDEIEPTESAMNYPCRYECDLFGASVPLWSVEQELKRDNPNMARLAVIVSKNHLDNLLSELREQSAHNQ